MIRSSFPALSASADVAMKSSGETETALGHTVLESLEHIANADLLSSTLSAS